MTIEIKVAVESARAARGLLRKAGLRVLCRVFEANTVFDTPNLVALGPWGGQSCGTFTRFRTRRQPAGGPKKIEAYGARSRVGRYESTFRPQTFG